jgi:probable F420-dependent oxidoreductase
VIDIGRVGLWTGVIDQYSTSRVRDLVQEVESIGWPCVWRPEASGRDAFVSCATMLEATTRLCVATGIAQIHARHPHTTRAGQKTLHESSGGRFLLGLGVSHAPFIEGSRGLPYRTPYSDMVDYLAAMESAPFTAIAADDEPPTVLAALGPKMLKLSATAAQGAHPYFATPEHTAYARDIMGTGPMLAPEQMVAIDNDVSRAREMAKGHMTRYLRLPNYTNNLLRLGFTEADVAGPTDRLIDAVVACGPIEVALERIAAQHAAGADHVAVQVLSNNNEIPLQHWHDLAEALGLR